MKTESTEKVLRRLMKRTEILRRDNGSGGHSGPHLVGERSPEWEIDCFEYDHAIEDVRMAILTELIKCGNI